MSETGIHLFDDAFDVGDDNRTRTLLNGDGQLSLRFFRLPALGDLLESDHCTIDDVGYGTFSLSCVRSNIYVVLAADMLK